MDETADRNACRRDKRHLPPYELYEDVVVFLQ